MDIKIIIGIVVVIILISSSLSVYMFTSKKSTPPPTTTLPPQPPPLQTQSEPEPVQAPPQPEKSKMSKYDMVKATNKQVAWKGMEYHTDQDLSGLDYVMSCNVPWNAYYKLNCTLPDGSNIYTNPYGPVGEKYKQGPTIRIAPQNEQNYCTQFGGKLTVLRQRPGDKEMVDVTEYLQNSKLTGAYNGVDSSFVDNYLMDC
jgi:cytoskeletal protein RodZ